MRHALLRVVAASLAASAVFACASASSLALSQAPGAIEEGSTPAPSAQQLSECKTVTRADGKKVGSFDGGKEGAVCGSFKKDKITLNGRGGPGGYVWAGPGDDTVNAKEKLPDYIDPGGGRDKIISDSCDTIVGRKLASPSGCPGTTPSGRLRFGAAITYPYAQPYVLCSTDSTGRRLMNIAPQPTMRAVDSTANIDWQKVAFSALLYKWDNQNQKWTLAAQDPWLWDRSYDQQVKSFSGNFWRRVDNNQRWFVWFNPTTPGIYRVEIDYHWYAGTRVKEHDEIVPVVYHVGPFAAPDQRSCTFPGAPLPTGHYAGTTDQQKNISFDVGPWLQPAPDPSTAWSVITKLSFTVSLNCTPPASADTILSPNGWIEIKPDGTFSYSYSGTLTSSTYRNASATYFVSGRIDASGSATGVLHIDRLSYDQSGTHYDCRGAPHTWSTRAAP